MAQDRAMDESAIRAIVGRHADRHELMTVIQFPFPAHGVAAVPDFDDQERVRLDHRELDDDGIELYRPSAVVRCCNRVMTLRDDATQNRHDDKGERSAHRTAPPAYFVSSQTT